jgi:glycosyltransferase involved in cell wall biosynthesis
MTAPTISIVTACYNSTPFLDRIHASLTAQTYPKFEWICVDDSSTDDTVERLVRLPPPGELGMQVYRLPQNTGGPVALAVGTQRARGDIVIWLDHDDELFPFALERVHSNWLRVQCEPSLSGLFLRAKSPTDGSMIGRELQAGLRLTWSEMGNRYPDVSDGTFALKREVFQRYATVQAMEDVALNGVLYERLTAVSSFVTADGPPIRYYHRDNPDSQTRLERVSRKTVASYGRLLDQADIHYLRTPVRWAKHAATFLRYSKQVHGRWFAGLRHISRPGIRLSVIALWPLGLLAYAGRPKADVVDIPVFRPEQAEDLHNLWRGPV